MQQRRWAKYLKDYDFSFSYHPGKANVVVDTLSRHTHVMVSLMVKEWTMLEDLADRGLKRLHRGAGGAYMASLSVHPKLLQFIIACQQMDSFIQATVEKMEAGDAPNFSFGVYEELRFD